MATEHLVFWIPLGLLLCIAQTFLIRPNQVMLICEIFLNLTAASFLKCASLDSSVRKMSDNNSFCKLRLVAPLFIKTGSSPYFEIGIFLHVYFGNDHSLKKLDYRKVHNLEILKNVNILLLYFILFIISIYYSIRH